MKEEFESKIKELREERKAVKAEYLAKQNALIERLTELFKEKLAHYGIDELMMFALTPSGYTPGSWECDDDEFDIEYEDANMADPPVWVLVFRDKIEDDDSYPSATYQAVITRIGIRNDELVFHTSRIMNQRDGDLTFGGLERDNWQDDWKPFSELSNPNQAQEILFTYLEHDGNWEFSKNHPECLFLHRKLDDKAISDRLKAYDGQEDLRCVFTENYQLKKIDLTGWNTSNARTLQALFYHCRYLEEVNLGGIDTRNCTSFESMFDGCSSLKSIDVSCLDTRNATTLQEMFRECNSLYRLDLSTFNTRNCDNVSMIFKGCTNLKELDLSNWGFNEAKVIGAADMFEGCVNLSKIVLRNVDEDTLNLIESCLEDEGLEDVEIIMD